MKITADMHTHSIASGHAYSTIIENAKYASENGITLLGLTEHAPKMPGATNSVYFVNIWTLPEEIFGVRLLKGVELNIVDYDGSVDLDNKIIESLDLVIASFHKPCIHFADKDEVMGCVYNIMNNKNIDILGHPGDPRYPMDYEELVKLSADTGTLIEINNTSLIPNNSRKGSIDGIKQILKECKKKSHPVVLGSDAHFAYSIGNFELTEKLFKEIEFPEELVLNTDNQRLLSCLKK